MIVFSTFLYILQESIRAVLACRACQATAVMLKPVVSAQPAVVFQREQWHEPIDCAQDLFESSFTWPNFKAAFQISAKYWIWALSDCQATNESVIIQGLWSLYDRLLQAVLCRTITCSRRCFASWAKLASFNFISLTGSFVARIWAEFLRLLLVRQ